MLTMKLCNKNELIVYVCPPFVLKFISNEKKQDNQHLSMYKSKFKKKLKNIL